MAWLEQRYAIQVLGIAQRTLSRRIAIGAIETKRNGHRVLVWVEPAEADRVESVTDVGAQLADVARAGAVQVAGLAQTSERAERRMIRVVAFAMASVASMAIAIIGAGLLAVPAYIEQKAEISRLTIQADKLAAEATIVQQALNTAVQRAENAEATALWLLTGGSERIAGR